MTSPLGISINVSEIPEQGRFGAVRKHDIHTGVDLYCKEFTPVFAMEGGRILRQVPFTGEYAESEWWHNTDALLIEGKSGVILYGEIQVENSLPEYVDEGMLIGYVRTVLKEDKGLPMTMLHIELYKNGYEGSGEWWKHSTIRPDKLLNVEEILRKVK